MKQFLGIAAVLMTLGACSSLPEPKVTKYVFPPDAHFGEPPNRPYKSMGMVRSKTDFISLNDKWDEDKLCRNYFNKAVQALVRDAKKSGADAVIDVKSVVFLVDGRVETYTTPECSDDGDEGQVLAQGIAVKWLEEIAPGEAIESNSPTPTPGPGKNPKSSAKDSPVTKKARQKSVGQGFVPTNPNQKELGQ